MKNKLNIGLSISAGILITVPMFANNLNDNKPNVIFILVDDMGYSDLGCYGGEIKTPNIDNLALNGIRLTQFYNTSRSCPTRASLMTGLYEHQTGIGEMTESPIHHPNKIDKEDQGVYGYRGFLNHNCVTIAEVLKDAGYHTYMTGKWHLGEHADNLKPCQRGFEHYYGILSGASSYLRPDGDRCLTLENKDLPAPKSPYYTTDAFTDYAIKFIDEQKDDKPFFLYLAYNAPHWPLQAKKKDIKLFYDIYRNNGWDKIRETRRQKMINLGIIPKGTKFAEWENRSWKELSAKEKDEVAYRMAVYAAQVYCMDYNVGKLVKYLKDNNLFDNSILMFMSDNGACAEPYKELGGGKFEDINNPACSGMSSYGRAWAQVSNTPFRKYKRRAYEGGISTPFIMSWPKQLSYLNNTWCKVPAYTPDIMPTILEATGTKYPTTYHGNIIPPYVGVSILPAIRKEKNSLHEYMYWEHAYNKAIRQGNLKAICDETGNVWELYDIVNDRTETNNLANKYPKKMEQLTAKWYQWAWNNKVFPKSSKKEWAKNRTYSNPVIDRAFPDPSVIKADDGYYYAYATEKIKNLPIYRSTDLVQWDFMGTAFTSKTRPTFEPEGRIWAPDINKIGNQYVLYYSMSKWGGEWTCGIGRAISNYAKGPFKDLGKLFRSNEINVQNCIDPFYIEDNGKKYLFFGSFRGIYYLPLNSDGLDIIADAKPIKIAGNAFEGSYIYKKNGYYYFFASIGACCKGLESTYQTVVARSKNLLGPYVDKNGKPMLENNYEIVIHKNNQFVGTGHNSEIIKDKKGNDWILYHAYETKSPKKGRVILLDQILWKDGWPYIKNNQPSIISNKPTL